MREPVTVWENVRYVDSFGAGWVQAVLMRKIDISFMERNRSHVALAANSLPISDSQSVCEPGLLSFFGIHFREGSKELPTDPRGVIEQCFSKSLLSKMVNRILSNAKLSEGDLHWRTELRNGEPNIAGSDEQTINALGALAHELGHCLYEQMGPKECSLRNQIMSEACAMALEEWIVSEALTDQERQRWFSHQRAIDQLNEQFFQLENAVCPPQLKEPHLLPLRTTFYTAIGYQSIYREASFTRKGALSHWPSNACALMQRFQLRPI